MSHKLNNSSSEGHGARLCGYGKVKALEHVFDIGRNDPLSIHFTKLIPGGFSNPSTGSALVPPVNCKIYSKVTVT